MWAGQDGSLDWARVAEMGEKMDELRNYLEVISTGFTLS